MAKPTQGTKIDFYVTDQSTYDSKKTNIGDGSLVFVPQTDNAGLGRIYIGKEMVANLGFETFSWKTTGSGDYIKSIDPSIVSTENGLALELTGTLGSPGNGTLTFKSGSSSVGTFTANQSGTSTITFAPGTGVSVSTNTSNNTFTFIHTDPSTGSAITPVASGSTTASTSAQTITYISQISKDAKGHITGAQSKTLSITLPTFSDAISKNVISDASNSSTEASAGNSSIWLNHYQGSTKRSAHRFQGGTAINISRSSSTSAVIWNHADVVTPDDSASTSFLRKFTYNAQGHITAATALTNGNVPTEYNPNAALGNSSTKIPSELVVKNAIDTALTSAVVYMGTVNASTLAELDKKAHKKGEMWVVATEGYLGATVKDDTTKVEIGDVIYYNKDVAANTTFARTQVDIVTGENQWNMPSSPVDIGTSATTLLTIEGKTLQAKITHQNSYAGISVANNSTGTSNIGTGTTKLTPVVPGDEFTFQAGNKWVQVCTDNSTNAGADKLTIGHFVPSSISSSTASSTLTSGGTFIVIEPTTIDAAGHVTAKKTTTYTLPTIPTVNNASLNFATGGTTYKSFTANASAASTVTFTGSDGITISGSNNGTFTFKHSNTGVVTATTANELRKFKYDAYGHITGAATVTKDDWNSSTFGPFWNVL